MANHLTLADIRHLLTSDQIAEQELLDKAPARKSGRSGVLPKLAGATVVDWRLPLVEGSSGPWEIMIPKWHPALINHMTEAHHMRIYRRKQADKRQLYITLLAYRIPPASTPRRLTLTLTYRRGQTACDPDAPFKSLLDGLVGIGALVDDSPEWLDLEKLRYGEPGGRRETLIRLEDIEPYKGSN